MRLSAHFGHWLEVVCRGRKARKSASGSGADLRSGEEKLPPAQADTGLTGNASWNRGRSQSRLAGIGSLWTVEHRHNFASQSDHPPWNSRAGSSHLGYGSAVLTPARPSGVVASFFSFCASSRIAAGSAHAASRTRWQPSGATLPAADASHGSRQKHPTMDGARGALLPLAAGFRLRGTKARCGCSVMSRGDG
jgi:hypothetical protein